MSGPLVKIVFVDQPATYPREVRCRSSMRAPLPERLRVALHRAALGVYDILVPGETAQESLWLTVDYERVGGDHDGRYKMVSRAGS